MRRTRITYTQIYGRGVCQYVLHDVTLIVHKFSIYIEVAHSAHGNRRAGLNYYLQRMSRLCHARCNFKISLVTPTHGTACRRRHMWFSQYSRPAWYGPVVGNVFDLVQLICMLLENAVVIILP